MNICPPSPPHPTLAYIMPQSDVPNLADTYMHIAPSSSKAKYLWEACNHAKEYASEARDRTPPPLPMNTESTDKSCHHEACNSPATPITPTMCCHSLSPEAPHTCCNSEDSYDNHKDPTLAKHTHTVQPIMPTLDEGMPTLLLPLMTNSADRAHCSNSNCF